MNLHLTCFLIETLVVIHVWSVPLLCPKGYTFQNGDAVGRQWAVRVNGKLFNASPTLGTCGKTCNKYKDCMAIEWSPSKQFCVLIKRSDTNGPKFEDYKFCSKEMEIREVSSSENRIMTIPYIMPTQPSLPRGGRSSKSCHCSTIVVSSMVPRKGIPSESFGVYKFTSSSNLLDRVAFGSTVYQNARQLSLLGGKKQHWRIQNWKRESLIRNKRCKKECPSDCTSKWEVYKTGLRYVKVKDLQFECFDDNFNPTPAEIENEGSGLPEGYTLNKDFGQKEP